MSIPLFALGLAGLLSAAETAPASAAAAAAAPAAAATPAAAVTPAAALAPTPAVVAPITDTIKATAVAAKPDSVKAKPAKKLSKKEAKAKALADSIARVDSLKAVAKADSLKAVALADSLRTAAVRDSVKADSLKTATRVADSARVAAAADSAAADSATSKSKKRKRIVRETTVNTIDELKGKYRSPKKALFMSLVVPGLGQAYVGQHWFNYTRGAAYFLADVAMAYGWHYYVVERQDATIKKYKAFADVNWRQYKYEDSVAKYPDKLDVRYPHRQTYCESVQDRSTSKGQSFYLGCIDPSKTVEYDPFKAFYNDESLSADSVGRMRSAFPNSHNFYEIIGKEQEFITGWLDANNVLIDTAFYERGPDGNPLKDAKGNNVLATSAFQQRYIDMRAQANDYARMQAYFLGGMVVNHIVSAIDAALTAHYHNKDLYQTESRWYDRLHLDSRMAWENSAPMPTVTASLTF